MAKNVQTPKSFNKAASDDAPGGMKTLSPAPGGKLTTNIKGPSVHTKNTGGDLKNANGIDGGTTVISD